MVFDKVRQIISEQLNVSADEITLTTSFADDLNADSLDVFQMIMALEEEFEIEIPNEEAEHVVTVADIVDYIKDQKGLD